MDDPSDVWHDVFPNPTIFVVWALLRHGFEKIGSGKSSHGVCCHDPFRTAVPFSGRNHSNYK